MNAESVRTSIDIPRDLHRRLRDKAARTGCSARELVLRAVERVLEEPEPVRPARRLSLESPIVGSVGRPFDLSSEEIYEIAELP